MDGVAGGLHNTIDLSNAYVLSDHRLMSKISLTNGFGFWDEMKTVLRLLDVSCTGLAT
jgi:hypothetical protein